MLEPTTVAILAVVLLVTLALYHGVRSWLDFKQDGVFTYQWNSVLNFAFTAVSAVAQMHQVKPEDMTQEAWNDLRFKEAMVMIESFANQFGIEITSHNYAAIKGAIEFAVKQVKPPKAGELSPIFNSGVQYHPQNVF